MTVTFCGHRELDDPGAIRPWLEDTVDHLIGVGADRFLLGGYGAFDALAASVVFQAKKKNPAVRSILVLPYLDRKADGSLYDSTLYPPLEAVPQRFAIVRRNEYMVAQSDVVVAYVLYSWGGAAATLRYAERQQKMIIRYPKT
ncbi:MAG: hypothetical protein IKI02_01880 [Oscillospiraceae bacterium]|nr:hypothetical protein [Oscillospiraceae bacterium]